MSEQLKPCPFCGGEVTIALGGNEREKWFVTRGFGENKCTCRVFMESELFLSDDSAEDKTKIKNKLVEAWNRREGVDHVR